MKNWNKILKDFAYKCGNGGPDMTNPNHLALLRESLIKFGWDENATNEFVGNLREAKKKPKENPWETHAGNWRGERSDGTKKSYTDRDKTMRWIGGEDVEDEDEKQDGEDKKGDGKVVASAEVKEEGKVEKMTESDPATGVLQDKFEEEIKNPVDEDESLRADYKEPRPEPLELTIGHEEDGTPIIVTVSTNPIDEGELAKIFPPGTPKKYIQLIARMLNAKADPKDSKKPAMLNFIEGSGAGVMPAQGAEVMTMAASTMDDDQFKAFMSIINQHNSNLVDPAESQRAELEEKEKTIESQRAELKNELSKKPKDAARIKSLRDNIKKLKKERTSLKENIKKLTKNNQPIFDNDWLQSISGARSVIRSFAVENGTTVSHCAWDLREDVTNMGFNYDSKGFSTDVFVRTDDGNIIQISLKKDTNVNLAQPSVGFTYVASVRLLPPEKQQQYKKNNDDLKKLKDKYGGLPGSVDEEKYEKALSTISSLTDESGDPIPDITPGQKTRLDRAQARVQKREDRLEYERLEEENYGIEDEGLAELFKDYPEANPRTAQKKQLELCNTVVEKFEDEKVVIRSITDQNVEDIINDDLTSFDGYSPEYVKDVVNVFKGMTPPIDDDKLKAALKAAGMISTTRAIEKAKNAINRVLARHNPESAVAKRHYDIEAEIRENDQNLQDHYLDACVKSTEMKEEVMRLIRGKFPIKSLLDGEEKIALGGLAGDQDIIQDIFDEDDYDNIESRLDTEDVYDPVTKKTKRYLIYKVKGSKSTIRVAEVVIRNKGIGYNNMESSTFELKLSDQMKWHLYCANIRKHGKEIVDERISDAEKKTQENLSSEKRFGPCLSKEKKE